MGLWDHRTPLYAAIPWDSEKAIREEVYGIERLLEHAKSLAIAQGISRSSHPSVPLRVRLQQNERVLLEAHRNIAMAISSGRSVTPAAEWLVNNSHVVEEQIRTIRRNLPSAFANQLPKLSDGPFAGYPRVFGIAWAFVAHTDSRFDRFRLEKFVEAYQTVDALTIGELWALPLMLHLVLVENLRRSARRIITSRDERREADDLVARLTKEPDKIAAELASVSIKSNEGAIRQSFVAELIYRLADGTDDVSRALPLLTGRLQADATTADDVVRSEHQSIAATNNTVRHIIRSLRLMPDVDWATVVEDLSVVDRVLNRNPNYAEMDFATRNTYRTVVEELARRAKHTEVEIAERAVALAAAPSAQGKAREPGYYLLGDGAKEFDANIGTRYWLKDIPAIVAQKGGLLGYVASIALLTFAILALPTLAMVGQAVPGWFIVLLAAVGILPAMDLATAIVNQAITHEIKPRIIPGLELADGVPSTARTLVVVPTLFSDKPGIDELITRLETHHLATHQDQVFYALLSDYTDAPSETMPADLELVEYARAGIAKLNRLHQAADTDDNRFYVLHRKRLWNASEERWMGWERKRGKLHELNRLLRGSNDTTFVALDARGGSVPHSIKYVVTLDSDTRLPKDTVTRLVGKMLHPLNTPVFSPERERVIDGYGLLQPRVTPTLPNETDASLFQRLFSSPGGIDPYAGAMSDVYQDLFGEGLFAGKGIYDVDAFEAATRGRFPDNTILSHDLIEGLYVRAGLATDVEVIEEFPSRYDVARARDHRWVRGDWQLLPWILTGEAKFSSSTRATARNRLTRLGRWKLLDNLRRSLTPIAVIIAVVMSWVLPLSAALIWTSFVLLSIGVPAFLSIAANLAPHSSEATTKSHFQALASDIQLAVAQSSLTFALSADKAYMMADAIVRSLYRLFVSRKHLLEWTTAAQTKAFAAGTTSAYYQRMAGSVAFSAAALIMAAVSGSNAIPLAIVITALWALAPAIAHWISFKPAGIARETLSLTETQTLRSVARRTWQFFETYITPADNYLPPDNFQEEPRPTVAHRTSPTNFGLYLLSTVSAREFGWISTVEAAERLEQTLRSMGRLDRHNGHYFNWYDTQSLAVLEPRYVSTVDSGNLAGHLIAVATSCRIWAQNPPPASAALDGVQDAIDLLLSGMPAADALVEAVLPGIVKELEAARATPFGAPDWVAVGRASSELASHLSHSTSSATCVQWAQAIERTCRSHQNQAALNAEDNRSLSRRLVAIADAAEYIALSMDFTFLLNTERELLSIGYSADADRLDESCYDLLASEARLASLFAIAKGDVPVRHWFRLGRTLLPVGGTSVLSSWSGSMFEYLMPDIVTLTPPDSLLGRTVRSAVREHIRYSASKGIPWGISESAFNARDIEFTYQYSSFGVPELGLKRGLADSLVIAPYATGLASMVAPRAAAENYVALSSIGGFGPYGFYEAIDFTPSRVPQTGSHEIVKAYMAHHQGMTVCAIANAVLDNVIARRFHATPLVQAAELLLQERAPRLVPKAVERATLIKIGTEDDEARNTVVRRFGLAGSSSANCHVLGNGSMSVLVTASGSGYVRWKGQAITRWHADATLDNLGSYLFLRDAQSGATWSAALQPVGGTPDRYQAVFSEDRAQFSRREGTLESILDIIACPDGDATCRRLSIRNTGKKTRIIDVTSYDELVLGPLDADSAHPAFSKLFVETHFDTAANALIAKRRKRSQQDSDISAAAFVTTDATIAAVQYESDRARFIGRGRTLSAPIAVINAQPMSNTAGTVLDPVFSLRQRVTVKPGETVRLAFWLVAASSDEALQGLIEKYSDRTAYNRSATLAWTMSLVELRHLGIDAEEAMLFQQLIGTILYASKSLRAPERHLQQGALGYGTLWSVGISGDLPIVLIQIDEVADIGLVRQCLHAFEYWRSKGFEADLVILNDHASSYQQDLQIALEALFQTVSSRHRLGRDNSKGSVYLLRADLLQPATRSALPAAARVVLHARRGSLAEQFALLLPPAQVPPAPAKRLAPSEISFDRSEPSDLEFFNGYGGFKRDGREYVVTLDTGKSTPAPWINVISNPSFGFQVSAEGAGYTWSVNSRERQVTPWSNDPVSNRPGEVFYVRDEETGELWSPTATPIRDHAAPYHIAHGQGYTRFEHTSRGVELVLEQFVAPLDPVKVSRLVIRNVSGRPRRLTVTSYAEWVLGSSRRATAPQITTDVDATRNAIYARNPWHFFFPDRVAFSYLSGTISSWTADRGDFFGPNGVLDNPASLAKGRKMRGLSGTGYDPCAALMSRVELEIGGEVEVIALLGDAANADEARTLVAKYSHTPPAQVLAASTASWEDLSGAIEIKTPDRALDILVNRWLPYQSLSSRIWARAGLYQAGGAFGFRDQLQDVMSLAMTRPEISRGHILRAASRQFPEGDVQHWWLSPSGHGIRTRIADSCLWLPFVTEHYARITGDAAILEELVPFIDGPQLQPHEHEVYFLPVVSNEYASLYEHCARALDRSLATGPKGLALFGGGDWNDGMNRVGIGGTGESVWLSWFLIACLDKFTPIAKDRNDTERVARWQTASASLRVKLDANAWDGEWYRRGYYDDGTPLGSKSNVECQIDAIAQSWSVISKGGNPARARQAMSSAMERLFDRDTGVAALFTPPFDTTDKDPGYIKGYPPGIRENGGQYTHAAIWSAIALVELGDGNGAMELLSTINPINIAASAASSRRYRLEPYVVAADVYSVGANVGRGGWSWYTGSAGWYYRAVIEYVLGVRQEGNVLLIKPTIPNDWPGFEISFRHQNRKVYVTVANPKGAATGIRSAFSNETPLTIRSDGSAVVPLDGSGDVTVSIELGTAPADAMAS